MNDTVRQFRKRPVVVEAVQWFKFGDHPEVDRYEYWREDLYAEHKHANCNHRFDEHGQIRTLETHIAGAQQVCPGDWIVKGIKGEFWPIKPDIFELTYEPVTAPTPHTGAGE